MSLVSAETIHLESGQRDRETKRSLDHSAGSSLFGNPIPPPPPFNSFPPPPPGYGAGGAGTCTCTPSGCNPQGCGNVNINALGPGARQRDLHIGVTAGAFTGGDVGDGHVDFVGDMAMCVNVMGRGGMRVGDCNFITDALAARPDQGHGRMESMTITAENEILDWEQCAEDWVEASSHRGTAGDCSALNAAHGASGSGCCHNTFGNSANDLALAEVLDSIRWSAYPADVTIQVSGLQQHTECECSTAHPVPVGSANSRPCWRTRQAPAAVPGALLHSCLRRLHLLRLFLLRSAARAGGLLPHARAGRRDSRR